ncbi:MAG: hypothetical protein JRH11_27925 [Deltaproteobacteria bacterium]|nr:hypothetical protein [Deltaproteobacteria bacterium]
MHSSSVAGRGLLIVVALLPGLLLGACEDETPPPRFRVTFRAEADGAALPGVRITADGQVLGATGDSGELGIEITGAEGQAMVIQAECPEGHRQPSQLPLLTLRAFQGLDPAAHARGIEMSIECPPAERHAVVVIRALDQDDKPVANLPVNVRGHEVARTNDGGVAHLHYAVPPNSTLRVNLGTDEVENIRPQNPGRTFSIADADEIYVLDQSFQRRVRRRRRGRMRRTMAAPVTRMGPVRIN